MCRLCQNLNLDLNLQENFGKDIGIKKGYLVEATLSKGFEQGLLKWFEELSPEQYSKIMAQAQKEGLTEISSLMKTFVSMI